MKKLFALIIVGLLGFYVGWPGYTGYQIRTALEAEDAALLARKIDFPQVRGSIRGPVMSEIDVRLGEMVQKYGGALGVTKDKIRMDRVGSIVDGALADVVSPEKLGGLYKRGGDVSGAIQQAVLRQIDKAGGLMTLIDSAGNAGGTGEDAGGNSASIGGFNVSGGIGGLLKSGEARKVLGEVSKQVGGGAGLDVSMLFPKKSAGTNSGGDSGSFSFGNIKHFGFDGQLEMELGVAKNAEAVQPDVTARMSFQDFDWKITGLAPNLGAQ